MTAQRSDKPADQAKPEGDMSNDAAVGSTSASLGGEPHKDMNGAPRCLPAPVDGTGSTEDAGRPTSNSGTSKTSIGGPSGQAA